MIKMGRKGLTSDWPSQYFGANLVQTEVFWKPDW